MKIVSLILMMCVVLTYSVYSQEEANPAQTGQDQPTVIDLTQMGKTYTFSARMELPQVRMFDKRINPDFKQLSAEKSFSVELSPQAEEIRYEPITSGKVKPIENIESLLKKKRF